MHNGVNTNFKKHFNFQAMVQDRRNRGSAGGAIAHQVLAKWPLGLMALKLVIRRTWFSLAGPPRQIFGWQDSHSDNHLTGAPPLPPPHSAEFYFVIFRQFGGIASCGGPDWYWTPQEQSKEICHTGSNQVILMSNEVGI